MKKTNYIGLLAVAAVVCWTSVETFRLWEATRQADASQQLQLRTGAKLETARARQTQVVHVEAPPSTTPVPK
jgi:hypothetical protein